MERIIREALSRYCPGQHVVGRKSMNQYNNQNLSMMTFKASIILPGQSPYDIWQVN